MPGYTFIGSNNVSFSPYTFIGLNNVMAHMD